MDTKILHYIVYPSGTLDAVCDEHGWQIAPIKETLRALRVPEAEITTLGELDWSHAADRIARERIRRGCPVHHRSVLLEVFAAFEVDRGKIPQSERRLAQALQMLGVKLVMVLSLVASENSLDLLADRLALELEKQDHRVTYQTVRQMLQQREFATLIPA